MFKLFNLYKNNIPKKEEEIFFNAKLSSKAIIKLDEFYNCDENLNKNFELPIYLIEVNTNKKYELKRYPGGSIDDEEYLYDIEKELKKSSQYDFSLKVEEYYDGYETNNYLVPKELYYEVTKKFSK